MIDLDLTPRERRKYRRALVQSHPLRIKVSILDQDEKGVGSLTAPEKTILDGMVAVDTSAEVKRSLNLRVLDPDAHLVFDKNWPGEDALFADKFIAVRREDWVDSLDRWVSCPVFWGPLTRFQRQHPVVDIEALGKESLYQGQAYIWRSMTLRKGTKVVAAIRQVMEAYGETRFDLPELPNELKHNVSIGRRDSGWKVCSRLASSINRQMFFDGLGRLRLRKFPDDPVFVFRFSQAVRDLKKDDRERPE